MDAAAKTELGRGSDPDPLAGFSAPTATWFAGAFSEPTAAQAGAWAAIAGGDHTLVVAPTGSGKTLSAFLWSIDAILTTPPPPAASRCRVLYISPLKALASDVERNLRSPLVGIGRTAESLGLASPQVKVGVRTGDTPASERRRFAGSPPDILITTPESLFLILTSAAHAGLAGVETVILDEVHVLAGSKRGAHLALSLERLDAMLPRPAQRIGLSATVRPVETVMSFLSGARPIAEGGRAVRLVQPSSHKELRIEVEVPVPDLTALDEAPAGSPATPDLSGDAAGALPQGERTASIWPHLVRRLLDVITAHRTTLVFANGRRTAERLTARLNEEWQTRAAQAAEDQAEAAEGRDEEAEGRDEEAEGRDEDQTAEPADSQPGSTPPAPSLPPGGGTVWPAHIPGQSGASLGAPALIARAHHGSMSREDRTRVEDELKSGRLPAVVATSSLELGIDMGSIDVVVQIGSPPSVASALQRIGRAGHQVGALSHGLVMPTHRADLLPAAVSAVRARAGLIEQVHPLRDPLDVLAQQIVAMLAMQDWTLTDLATVIRRATPFSTLGEGVLASVLDMLAGRYPGEDFAGLRARIVWDRASGTLSGRPGSQLLAATSGGTIPDRGLFGVYLAGSSESGSKDAVAPRGGRRVGELDEEMVFESRVGDTFTLGTSTWRIEQITPDRVLVTPAPGLPGRLPFWKGDQPGRPAELGMALGAMVRQATGAGAGAERLRENLAGWDLGPWMLDNLTAYLSEQRAATGVLPDDTTIVLERFRDDIGDWRLVLHSPFGSAVHAPWAVVLAARLRERLGTDVGVMHADDGIVLRIPDVSDPISPWDPPPPATAERAPIRDASSPLRFEDLLVDPEEVRDLVVAALGASSHFAARFREAAARALLLPRRRPDRRQPLWQQRQRASQLLAVAGQYPQFPIVLEAVRECLQDDFDTPALTELMRRIASREVRLIEVETPAPSPFARSLLFAYVGTFLYDGDAPLAERRAAALTLDPTLLAELLGAGASDLADLLDPAAVLAVEAEVGRYAPGRQVTSREQTADLLASHGPLTLTQVQRRSSDPTSAAAFLADLGRERRAIRLRLGGEEVWAAVEDAGRLRDGLGLALPVGIPETFLEPVPDPLGDLVRRHARTHGPFTAAQVAARFALAPGTLVATLRTLEQDGLLVTGRLRPEADHTGVPPDGVDGSDLPGHRGRAEEYCDAEVLRRMRRRSLAAARADVEAVPARALGIFAPRWHQFGALHGSEGVLAAVEQLAGVALDVADLETSVLPARVVDYAPTQLDALTTSGEVVWVGLTPPRTGVGPGQVTLLPTEAVALLAPDPSEPVHPLAPRVLAALSSGGRFFRDLVLAVGADCEQRGEAPAAPGEVEAALWDCVWSGLVTNDTLAPLRALARATGRTTASRAAAPTPTARLRRLSRSTLLSPGPSGGEGRIATPPTAVGRWSLVGAREPDPALRATARAAALVERHGVVLRGIAAAEGLPGGFGALYPILARLEDAGVLRRGYLVEGQGAAQFALPECVDRLRADAQRSPGALVMAAADPANPYGSLVPWPSPASAETPASGEYSGTGEQAGTGENATSAESAVVGRPRRVAGADVVMVDGLLALFLERGGGSALTLTSDPDVLRRAVAALAEVAPTRYSGLTLRRLDGENAHTASSPLRAELLAAGFTASPKGLRPPRGGRRA